jgi:hypothetical protein
VHPHDTDSVYHYKGTAREEEDASSDEQEELGWIPGEVLERQTYAAERTERVSKGTRKEVQGNPPSLTQGVKILPKRREAQGFNRQQAPIDKKTNFNRNHAGFPKRATPSDVHQNKLEAKTDRQLLPMQVDQEVISNLGNHPRKEPTRQGEGKIIKVTNPGSEKSRNSKAVAQDILDTPLTMTIREAVKISPILQRDLVSATKAKNEVLPQNEERIGLVGVVASRDDDDDDDDGDQQSSSDSEDIIVRLQSQEKTYSKYHSRLGKQQ